MRFNVHAAYVNEQEYVPDELQTHSHRHTYTRAHAHTHTHTCTHMHIHTHTHTRVRAHIHIHTLSFCLTHSMGWLQLVGSLKLYVSLENIGLYCRALLQKRPKLLRSLLVIAIPYPSLSRARTTDQ